MRRKTDSPYMSPKSLVVHIREEPAQNDHERSYVPLKPKSFDPLFQAQKFWNPDHILRIF